MSFYSNKNNLDITKNLYVLTHTDIFLLIFLF
jgi:hypothetical protein